MHIATRDSRIRLGLGLTLALGLSLPLVVAESGQAQEQEEQRSIGQQITERVAELETERAELDELAKKVDANPDHATTIMMKKEISERRGEFRRKVAGLVDLVLSAEDAGAEAAQGRAAATEILEKEAPIRLSNLMAICPECGKPTRVSHRHLEDGKNVRICKKCQGVIDKA
jgi:hypothetical protein